MKLSRHTRTARGGFTLVELLIVIAIIGLLIGLISAAVIKALSTGNQTANMAEIRKMAAAVQAFETQFKLKHIPSRIKLCKYLAHYDLQNPANPEYALNKDSVDFLNQVWPRLRWTTLNGAQVVYHRIDWNGLPNGGLLTTPTPAPNVDNVFTLQGSQCLVFFLGGIPTAPASTNGTQGFSTNPLNPAWFVVDANSTERVSPFYEFKSNRLTRPSGPFFHYLDAYGSKPYAYFSSYGKRNGYNRYSSIPLPAGPSGGAPFSDCHALGVFPYAEELSNPGRYLNPESFQIISAGANERFGRGALNASALWNSTSAGLNTQSLWDFTAPPTNAEAGKDDLSNFHSLVLGVAGE